MNIYIATSGYRLPSSFIVKEICCLFPNGEYNHYILKPPTNWDLSDVDKRTIRFATKNLNNLSYHDGDIPYENIEAIFTRYQEYQVYTYSSVTFKLVQNIFFFFFFVQGAGLPRRSGSTERLGKISYQQLSLLLYKV